MALPTKVTIYQLNDSYVEIDGLHDGLDATIYFNSATVTANLKDSAGTNVAGATNITLVYVTASNGVYRGAIAETFNPTAGGGYTLELTAVQGSSTGFWKFPAQVVVRTGKTG